jgi:hypothetical protein
MIRSDFNILEPIKSTGISKTTRDARELDAGTLCLGDSWLIATALKSTFPEACRSLHPILGVRHRGSDFRWDLPCLPNLEFESNSRRLSIPKTSSQLIISSRNMFAKTILTAAAALGVATAQTGPGFPIPATQALTVSFGNNTVSPAGELIPRAGMVARPLREHL